MRPAKRGGAFCAAAVPSVFPYVLLNYTARRRDVLTLAHELGHGVHFALAARQGIFHQNTPLTLAETASVFAETIVFGALLEEDSSPASRLALLAGNLEDTIATVFRQVAMNRFEDLVHTARREQGELSVERFGELWAESQTELLGDSVELTEGYRSLVVLRPALHRLARLRLRLRLRSAARAVGLRALRAAGGRARAPLSGDARRGGVEKPRGAGTDRRRRPGGSRASGTRAWILSSASSRRPKRRRRRRDGCSRCGWGSEQPERAAHMAHEVEQRLGDDAEEQRRCPGEHGDEDDLWLQTLERRRPRGSHPPSRAGGP